MSKALRGAPGTAIADPLSRGFSLIEVLIATLLISSAIAGLAHLAAIGVRQGHAARHATSSLSLAQSKLEELRAVAWSYDASGTRISSPALTLSPLGSLVEDYTGFTDAIDAFGEPASSPELAEYRRRWGITRLIPTDEDTLVLQVCVVPLDQTGAGWTRAPEACVSTIRTRKP